MCELSTQNRVTPTRALRRAPAQPTEALRGEAALEAEVVGFLEADAAADDAEVGALLVEPDPDAVAAGVEPVCEGVARGAVVWPSIWAWIAALNFPFMLSRLDSHWLGIATQGNRNNILEFRRESHGRVFLGRIIFERQRFDTDEVFAASGTNATVRGELDRAGF